MPLQQLVCSGQLSCLPPLLHIAQDPLRRIASASITSYHPYMYGSSEQPPPSKHGASSWHWWLPWRPQKCCTEGVGGAVSCTSVEAPQSVQRRTHRGLLCFGARQLSASRPELQARLLRILRGRRQLHARAPQVIPLHSRHTPSASPPRFTPPGTPFCSAHAATTRCQGSLNLQGTLPGVRCCSHSPHASLESAGFAAPSFSNKHIALPPVGSPQHVSHVSFMPDICMTVHLRQMAWE